MQYVVSRRGEYISQREFERLEEYCDHILEANDYLRRELERESTSSDDMCYHAQKELTDLKEKQTELDKIRQRNENELNQVKRRVTALEQDLTQARSETKSAEHQRDQASEKLATVEALKAALFNALQKQQREREMANEIHPSKVDPTDVGPPTERKNPTKDDDTTKFQQEIEEFDEAEHPDQDIRQKYPAELKLRLATTALVLAVSAALEVSKIKTDLKVASMEAAAREQALQAKRLADDQQRDLTVLV